MIRKRSRPMLQTSSPLTRAFNPCECSGFSGNSAARTATASGTRGKTRSRGSRLPTALLVLCALLIGGGTAPAVLAPAPTGTDAAGSVRFGVVHVYVDSGNVPLGAYQFEITAKNGHVDLVGLEGGDHPAFHKAPYYDTHALLQDRIIVAAFSTADDLPKGKTRVATLQVRVTGDVDPAYTGTLQVAASSQGKPIDAKLIVSPVIVAAPAALTTSGTSGTSATQSTQPSTASEGALR